MVWKQRREGMGMNMGEMHNGFIQLNNLSKKKKKTFLDHKVTV